MERDLAVQMLDRDLLKVLHSLRMIGIEFCNRRVQHGFTSRCDFRVD